MNQSTIENGTFRKKTGYTTVVNPVARDRMVPLRARGLYLMIQSYITMPNFVLTQSFIRDKCTEGKKAFDRIWDELKNNGYLVVHMHPNKGNWRVEYDLLDERRDDGIHTIYYTAAGKVSKTNLTRAGKKAAPEAKEKQRYPQKGIYAKGNNAEGMYAQGNNADGGNNNKPIVKPKNNPFCNTQSINPHDGTDAIEEYKNIENMVKENIEYYRLIETYGAAEIDEMVTLISDALYSKQETVRIGRADYPADIVKDRFMKLDSTHVEYVIDSMSKTSSDIKNIRGYTLTTLYNAPGSMKKHYAARVNHDMYGDTGY